MISITTSGGAGCASVTQEGIAVHFLEVGVNRDLGADTPLDQVEKSGDMTLLEGHRAHSDPGELPADDSWSFKGSY